MKKKKQTDKQTKKTKKNQYTVPGYISEKFLFSMVSCFVILSACYLTFQHYFFKTEFEIMDYVEVVNFNNCSTSFKIIKLKPMF